MAEAVRERESECTVCPPTLGRKGMPLERCFHLDGVGFVRMFAFDDEWAVVGSDTAKGGFSLVESIVAKARTEFDKCCAELLRLGGGDG